ncbi:YeeE/YedE family protein [Noviherbaspirillum denitrificans]|uniref:YeeE/YedE n=1 Tax=Noviherbaspirillum denitrificans TaxID=1968433 RepID=A0A254T7P6_9BURK|nr:YeeE/YedE family protein [Noviherbaspirillum denitrificans]OWW18661.1 YeeE/YedE [Noviherbaspirillum denitrificans]
MTIDWNNFTPQAALAGGLLIGVAAGALALFNGRIAGISGIVAGVLRPRDGVPAWRLAFIAGLVGAPALYGVFATLPEADISANWMVLVAAGLLVGVGSRYGSGCTSGHAVCGLSRLSPRSLVATLVFMGSGFLTVFAVRHLLGG